MIEFLRESGREFLLVVDGKIVENTRVSESTDRTSRSPYYEIHSSNSNFYEEIKDQTLNDFPSLYLIRFLTKFEWLDGQVSVDCWLMSQENSLDNKNKSFEISLDFNASLEDWTGTFAFSQYFNELKKIIDQRQDLEISMSDESAGLEYGFLINQVKKAITSEKIHYLLEDFFKEIETLNLKIERKLSKSHSDDLPQFSFNFPTELKVQCEQYLLYFAKFLQDIGIKATSNLKEEAGKVLFSVTPTDDVEALGKIREALAVYLNLPASPISDLEYSENFALMRLQQQVRNLQHSQQMAKTELLSAQYALGLAQSNIENQDQIIVRQHSTIENLNKVIEKITSSSIMTDSLDEKDKEKFEEICEGLRVGESKWLRELTGVGLSTGKFVKAIVKNTFGKEEKNSILGLDEE